MVKKPRKYIFVSGGVISGVGKGITTASISLLLKSHGYKVSPFKCDPYINVDAGTMNPTEHGEVFVTDDGAETDQDLGNYERFLNENLSKLNFTTTGKVYSEIIDRERRLEFEGRCVEVVPDVPNQIISQIDLLADKSKADIVVVEIGGTVGEYQNTLFLEANRILKLLHPKDVVHIHVGYLPTPKSIGEMKSKPIQQSVRMLNSFGLQPDFLICRSEFPMDQKRKDKLSLFCNMIPENIISNPDVESIYDIPIILNSQKFCNQILKKLFLKKKNSKIAAWEKYVQKTKNPKKTINIAVVGKYFNTGDFNLSDSYISVIEAIKHAGVANSVAVKLSWIDSQTLDSDKKTKEVLSEFSGIVVPGGFGVRGVDGIIRAIKYARTENVPYLGLCYGLHLAVVEFCRNVLGISDADTTEISPKTKNPVIDIMESQKIKLANAQMGNSMRLGLYKCKLFPSSLAKKLYNKSIIFERHRHRYEVNNSYVNKFTKVGLEVSGINPESGLVEIIEIPTHSFFIASQFHPELLSRPLSPHPMFVGFIKSAIK
ncbi:CTP synthase [Candidatus Curtissbacteria bacterium]|nr:CTP synthase [Candidatus Curtissbacteria bacterium]